MTEFLAENSLLITGPGVWMESNALEQLAAVAATPGCMRAVGMPDLHAGPGVPIGAALAFGDGVRPPLIGGDAGCGARVVFLSRVKAGGDVTERRIREWTEGPALPDADPVALFRAVWFHGPRGLAGVEGVPESLQELAALEPLDTDSPSGPLPPEAEGGSQAGTIGGGNHFLELSRISQVVREMPSLGTARGELAVVAHSGSRGLGRALASRWPVGPLLGKELEEWLGELAGALRYARANRLVLVWRMLCALGAQRPGKILGSFDIVHNTVEKARVNGADGWVHRKGCAPAGVGQPTIVLGSRGAPSWVMEGLGQEAALCSVAHGAGRRMARSEASAKLKAKYTRSSLLRTALGGRVLCEDSQLLYEEHPDAYKPVEPVIAALEAAGCARRAAALEPLFTVKR